MLWTISIPSKARFKLCRSAGHPGRVRAAAQCSRACHRADNTCRESEPHDLPDIGRNSLPVYPLAPVTRIFGFMLFHPTEDILSCLFGCIGGRSTVVKRIATRKSGQPRRTEPHLALAPPPLPPACASCSSRAPPATSRRTSSGNRPAACPWRQGSCEGKRDPSSSPPFPPGRCAGNNNPGCRARIFASVALPRPGAPWQSCCRIV